jgi:hypothetical protein
VSVEHDILRAGSALVINWSSVPSVASQESDLNWPNKITGAKAGGPRRSPIWEPRAARTAQFRR